MNLAAKFKGFSSVSALALLLLCINFSSCRKLKSGVFVRVSVTDANTAKVWRKGSDDGRLWTLLIRTGEGIGGQINGNIARVADGTVILVLQAITEQFLNLPADAAVAAELKQRLQDLVKENPALKKLEQKWNLLGRAAGAITNVAGQLRWQNQLVQGFKLQTISGLLNFLKNIVKILNNFPQFKPIADVWEKALNDPKISARQLDLNNLNSVFQNISLALVEGFRLLVYDQAAANVFLLHWWLVDPKLAQYLVLWLSSALQANLITAGGETQENIQNYKTMLEIAEKNGFSAKLGSGIAKIIGHTGKHGGPKIITADIKRSVITDALVSAEDSNHNDAKISWIKVTYIDKNGKRIEDNIGEQPIGADFSKEYRVPNLQTITVTARATQTGETKGLAQHIQELSDVGEFNHQTTLPELRDGIHRLLAYRKHWLDSMPGKRVGNARVRLKLELLQDGIVIGSKEIEAEKEVEATSVSYGG